MNTSYFRKRPNFIYFLHFGALLLALSSIYISGILSPGLGFSIVISTFIILDILGTSSKDPSSFSICYGNIVKGGIKRGIFIRELVALAMLYSSINNYINDNTKTATINLVLFLALALSSIANEIEANLNKKRY